MGDDNRDLDLGFTGQPMFSRIIRFTEIDFATSHKARAHKNEIRKSIPCLHPQPFGGSLAMSATSTTTTTICMFQSTKLSRARPSRLHLTSSSHRNRSASSLCQRVRLRNVAMAARLHVRALATEDDGDKLAGLPKSMLSIHVGALLMSMVEQPALAVTGVNDEEDLIWVITQIAIIAFWYFIIMPPIIMNWLRVRWYRRKLLEMYLQFMFVFMFFPGVLLWAPFLNFRKFPRDPSLKYPWSEPEDPSQVKNGYLKYPFAQPEDYD